ncbi:unnamed protein product [Urochloa decumbens]|uniref:RBR-type E3 ubiquitin transferase n=1 Tax=Urochloa decumbens TaxID=240449 RepID=A0ABC9DVS7_9POAL
MAGAGDADDLAALLEQVSVSSASDRDLVYQLQLAEAVQASPRSSDAAYALALHAADLALAEIGRRDARFARELAAVPEDRWARDGDRLERPLGSPDGASSSAPLFRVFFKGMASRNVVGPRDRDPGVAVLAAAVYGPQGEVVVRVQKPVEWFVGGREVLEAMALMEGLHAALALGVRSVGIVTDYRPLRNHILGIWSIAQNKVADVVDQILSVVMEFEECAILLVRPREDSYVIKLARDYMNSQITKALAVNTSKDKRETCTICLEDTDVSKIHAVEGCAHRFCFSCMKEHVKVKLLNGMLPACPQDGCATKLSVEGSKIFLSAQLLEIMVERIREGQIPPSQKIYCPYPKCSALMSLSELIHPLQESCSKYMVADATTLRKCVKCRGSFCFRCKVPWHYRMSCYDYKRRHPHARPEDAKLKNLAEQKLWRQCVKCKHMIELSEGCYHMTCVCGYEFCYTCGKEWKEKKATCPCPLWNESNIIHYDSEDDYSDEEEDDYYYEDDDENIYYVEEQRGYNQVYWHHDNGGPHRPDNNYRRNY